MIPKNRNALILRASKSHLFRVALMFGFGQLGATRFQEVKMGLSERLFRSVLYIPGSKARALDKARGLAAAPVSVTMRIVVLPPRGA